jgi:hypothetical protein
VLQKLNAPATPTSPEAAPDLAPDRIGKVWTRISICQSAAMLHLEKQSIYWGVTATIRAIFAVKPVTLPQRSQALARQDCSHLSLQRRTRDTYALQL